MVSKIDIEIIRILQKNARESIAEIARKIKLSENAVKYRLNKLMRDRYILEYSAKLNPEKLGKNLLAILYLKIAPRSIKSALSLLARQEELTKIYVTTGEYEIMAISYFEDNNALYDFVVNTLLQEVPVQDYLVQVVLERIKDDNFKI